MRKFRALIQRVKGIGREAGEGMQLAVTSFSGLNYGLGRKFGLVAINSDFRQAKHRWILDWDLMAPSPSSTILNPANREHLNKMRGAVCLQRIYRD